MVGDTGGTEVIEATVTYDLRCRRHWLEGREDLGQDSLFDVV